MRQSVILLLVLCCLPWQLSAQGFQEGVHYKRLSSPQPVIQGKVEVIEFFWYGCPHCADFEPYMLKWKESQPDNVKVTLVPAIFRDSWKVHARAFYAAEQLGILDKIHPIMFDIIHKEKKELNTPEEVVKIFLGQGVDREQALSAMSSFAVETKVRKAMQLARDYRIQGVPAVAINGKYLTGGSQAGSYSSLLKVMDHLVALESQS